MLCGGYAEQVHVIVQRSWCRGAEVMVQSRCRAYIGGAEQVQSRQQVQSRCRAGAEHIMQVVQRCCRGVAEVLQRLC